MHPEIGSAAALILPARDLRNATRGPSISRTLVLLTSAWISREFSGRIPRMSLVGPGNAYWPTPWVPARRRMATILPITASSVTSDKTHGDVARLVP